MDEKTDMEKFIELYRSFGIELEAKPITDGYIIIMTAKINGFYGWFGYHSDVQFDHNGKFANQGFWKFANFANQS